MCQNYLKFAFMFYIRVLLNTRYTGGLEISWLSNKSRREGGLLINTIFSHVFLIFNYWNFDIEMFVLRSSILVQVIKSFGIINKWRGGSIQIRSIGRVGKKFKTKQAQAAMFIWHSRVDAFINAANLCWNGLKCE